MADATTRPARARGTKATTKSTAAKAAPAKTASAPTGATTEDGKTRIGLVLEAAGETKSYAVFSPPAGSGCVGKFYAPLGTEEVRVLLIGPAE